MDFLLQIKLKMNVMNAKILKSTLELIGQKLGKLRQKKGYVSIKDFARDHKLPQIQYWRIEKGKANLTVKSLVKVLAIHHLSIEEFFCKPRYH
jgi:transcriptional regulator with XRE-family HTH domain